MAEIDGGALSFKSVMDNDQMNAAIEETLRRVQGLSDGTVSGGKQMDAAFNATAESIRAALGQIGAACEMHEKELASLESEYQRLGQKASAAFMAGRDDEYNAITKQQEAVKGEITVRERLLQELREQSNALEDNAHKLDEDRRKAETAAKAHGMLRTQLMNAKNALAEMEEAGLRGTKQFADMQREVGRLQNAMGDANAQAKIMSHDNAGLQGVISGVSGLSGALSAATGAVSLFAGENKNLQKVMTKVQSVMAISMGIQQVANVLNKDSAFSIVTLGRLKEWWSGVVAKATVAETAETAATAANTTATAANAVATGAQATAATAGTVANLGLAGAIRLVGVAIKSIPVFGWILAGISALIGLVATLSSKARAARKAQEELSKSMIEGCYKPIGSVQYLSSQWSALGDNLDEKMVFIEQNKKAFDELGISIRDVADAENLLVKNKDAFINAQIEKAKAAAILANSDGLMKQWVEADLKLKEAKKTPTIERTSISRATGTAKTWTEVNPAIKRAEDELNEINKKLEGIFSDAAEHTAKGYKQLKQAGIDGQDEMTKGTIAWYEKMIADKNEKLKQALPGSDDFNEAKKAIDEYQKELDKITGKTANGGTNSKDPYLEKLESRKREYDRFLKWVNSGDESIAKAANTEFAGLLKEGASYIDYLKNQRETILSVDVANRTKAQNAQLRTLNDQIAEETKKTVLETFNNELAEQLSNAQSILEILNIIEQKRKDLANDGTALDNEKKEALDEAESDALAKQKEETDKMIDDYANYLDKRIGLNMEFENRMAALRARAAKAESADERIRIDKIADMYEELHALNLDNFEQLDQINAESLYRLGTFEQKRLMIIKQYDTLIGAAMLSGHKDLARKLEGERDMEIMKETEQYKEFFGDISEISLKTLRNTQSALLTMMQEAYQAGKITYEQYKELIDKINKQMDSATNGRGIEAVFGNSKGGGIMNLLFGEGDFKSKIDSFKNLFSKSKGDMSSMAGSSDKVAGNMGKAAGAAKGAAGSAAGTLTIIDAIITAVYQTLRAVSDTLKTIADYQESIGNSDSSDTLQDWANCINAVNDTAMSGWDNLKNGDVMGAISDTISLPFKLLTTLNQIHDKNIDKNIKKHAEAVRDLDIAYNELAWAIENALGGDAYSNQRKMIDNLNRQRREIREMWKLEESKKNPDSGKIDDYREQYNDLGRQIKDIMNEITRDVLQTDAKSFADELGDALVNAFGKGEDAAEAFGKTVNNIIREAVLNQLKKNFLEKQLQGALYGLEQSLGYWNGNDFIFDGLTEAEIEAFKAQVGNITEGFNQAMDAYSEIFKNITPDEPNTSLTGAVKGVSEETASMVAGQMNAMRINQMEATAIMRQQLAALSTIAINTSYNYHLGKLERIVYLLENAQMGNSLRAQGLS